MLQSLGGERAIEAALGCSHRVVRNWPRTGIPAKHWPSLVGMGNRLGVKGVTFAALRSMSHAEVVASRAKAAAARSDDAHAEREAHAAYQA